MLYFNQHLAIYLLGVSDSAKVIIFSFKTKWARASVAQLVGASSPGLKGRGHIPRLWVQLGFIQEDSQLMFLSLCLSLCLSQNQ